MPETSISPPVSARPSKPVSEALLNEKVIIKCCPSELFMITFEDWRIFELCIQMDCWLTNLVGPLSFFPPYPIITRSIIRRRILSITVQAEGVACVGWIRFRCGKSVRGMQWQLFEKWKGRCENPTPLRRTSSGTNGLNNALEGLGVVWLYKIHGWRQRGVIYHPSNRGIFVVYCVHTTFHEVTLLFISFSVNTECKFWRSGCWNGC